MVQINIVKLKEILEPKIKEAMDKAQEARDDDNHTASLILITEAKTLNTVLNAIQASVE